MELIDLEEQLRAKLADEWFLYDPRLAQEKAGKSIRALPD
jgi:hypothetical protein